MGPTWPAKQGIATGAVVYAAPIRREGPKVSRFIHVTIDPVGMGLACPRDTSPTAPSPLFIPPRRDELAVGQSGTAVTISGAAKVRRDATVAQELSD